MQRCQKWAEQLMDRTKLFPAIQKADSNLRCILYGVVLLCLVTWLLIRAAKLLRKPALSRSATPDLEKPLARTFKVPQRTPGGLHNPLKHILPSTNREAVWEPMDFKRPTAAPAPAWDVHTSKPNPYRPFRHGPYHITMGLRNMNWDEWIGELSLFQ